MTDEKHHMACQREVTGGFEPCDCRTPADEIARLQRILEENDRQNLAQASEELLHKLTEARAGWGETSERCQLLLRALELIRNFHDCPPVIRALAENAINWTPTNE